MNILHKTKKIVALFLVLTVVSISLSFGTELVSAKQTEPQGIGDTYDYFANSYGGD